MADSKSIITLAMLPMQDIANYLEIVKGHAVKKENATDTERVAGIDADHIAIAAMDGEGNLINGRDTVMNALKLGGINADQYLTLEGSGALLDDTYKVSSTVSSELKSVRDELYQLKAELAKQGYIKQSDVYDGFYDAFRKGEIKYNDKPITTVSSSVSAGSTSIPANNAGSVDLMPGEFIGVLDSNGIMHSAQIEDIKNSVIEIKNALGITIDAGTEIYKYAGSYYNGEFIFGKDSGQYISDNTVKAIVKDGKDRIQVKTLGKGSKGFATKLSNYYSTYGSLIRSVEFSLAYMGNPGNIRASIWKQGMNFVTEEVECTLLGTSESVYPSSCSTSFAPVEFEFNEPIEIEQGTDYLIALYCGGADDNNVWRIGGYKDDYNEIDHLWFTDDTYEFDGNDSFTVIPGSEDAYLALAISERVQANILYNNSGLYSFEKEIRNGFTRIRVELKVNREGIYSVSSDAALSTKAGGALKIAGDSKADPFDDGDKVIVGNMFSVLSGDCTTESLKMINDMYTPAGADVYRVGYSVIAKCKSKLSDVDNMFGNPVLVELPLVAVMPGKESGKEAISSDRLIFEAEVATKNDSKILEEFNLLELQVHWNSSVSSNTINSNPQFAGKILDISVSTDKSYSKTKEE